MPIDTAHARKGGIVEDHRDIILRELHIELDAVACLNRMSESAKGVLRCIAVIVKQSAVRVMSAIEKASVRLVEHARKD